MKRWLTRILICLLLGAIINIAVAWTLAYTVNVANGTQANSASIAERSSTTVFRWHAFGSVRWSSSLNRHGLAMSPDALVRGATLLPDCANQMNWPTHQTLDPSTLSETLLVDARGWPFKSLSAIGRTEVAADLQADVSMTGIEITSQPWTSRGTVADVRVLPTQPIWLHFYWNTLFYAVVVYFLLFGFTDFRRANRRIRGRCSRCGHQLTRDQTTCPECGWRRGDHRTTIAESNTAPRSQ